MSADAAPEDAMQQAREQAVTEQVVATFEGSGDERYREVMQSLVRHLHAFARDVRLTEAEWETAIAFLTETGQKCSGTRQEFILLSDVLGLSMMTVGINSPARGDATEATVFGPFFVQDSPHVELGGDIAEGVTGRPCYVHGTVTDVDGYSIPGARIEVWEADDDGFYDVQLDHGKLMGRAHMFSSETGEYDFWSVQPAPYPIPNDGPVGRLLDAANRPYMRPAHIHYMVTAPGYRTLITHIFVAGDPHLDSDAVFGVKDSLVVDFVEQPAGPAPRGRTTETPWVDVAFDIVLAPAR